jgi:pyruvate-ferredoxin/flavodoxin oxidoreductase
MQEGWIKSKKYPVVVGGRYGLGSAEFTPAMVKAVWDNLKQAKPKNHFSVGVTDDVMNTSLEFDPGFSVESGVYRAMFYGLGSDGTVSANKNSIKIIADETDNYTQGYFEYDSKKAGAVTVSHLRFGKKPIFSHYLITSANFLACHNFSFLERFDMLKNLTSGGTFLLTSMYDKDEVWQKLPGMVQKQIIDKKIKFYVINAIKIAEQLGLGARINTIMQAAFFKISKVIDEKIAIDAIKDAIKKTYAKKGDEVVKMNIDAVDMALNNIQEVKVPDKPSNPVLEITCEGMQGVDVPEFVKEVTCKIIKREGADIKVSQMPSDGTWPTATSQYEKRNIAVNIPSWNPQTCIQCGRCSLVCPHAAIRMKMYDGKLLGKAPEGFKSTEPKGKGVKEGMKFTLQVAPEDCTGCGTCVENCPVKDKEAIKMVLQAPLRAKEAENYKFFLELPETDPKLFDKNTLKGSQFIRPLFEYSGACAGCGETAYVKLLTQLFGDRLMVANATGCSSIYGGNLPTTPYTKRPDGRGPTWSNSLFEDAAEFAYGMRLAVDKFNQYALELVDKILNEDHKLEKLKDLLQETKLADQSSQENIELQRERISRLKKMLVAIKSAPAKELLSVVDYLVKKSVWGVGGDGWAYDIGYGGLDHVLASGRNINILVLDTEVYSNTGGQASKSTPRAAVAQFAMAGKPTAKKNLAMMLMSYGYIYVAKVSIGADPNQLVRAFTEAEAYNGPSIIIAYAHCIAHGIDMGCALLNDQKKAVASGHWQLCRFNPDLKKEGKNPFVLDSKDPTISFQEYAYGENRYKVLKKTNPKAAEELMKLAQEDAAARFKLYKQLSQLSCDTQQGEQK